MPFGPPIGYVILAGRFPCPTVHSLRPAALRPCGPVTLRPCGPATCDMRPVTCAILDPNTEFRRRLREWLEEAGDIAVVGEAGDEENAQELIAAWCPRVLLANLEVLGSAERVTRITAHSPETRILILHRQEDQANVLEALRAGAWGHLARETVGPEEAVEAVRTVAQGDAYLSPTVAGWVVEEVARRLREQGGEI